MAVNEDRTIFIPGKSEIDSLVEAISQIPGLHEGWEAVENRQNYYRRRAIHNAKTIKLNIPIAMEI